MRRSNLFEKVISKTKPHVAHIIFEIVDGWCMMGHQQIADHHQHQDHRRGSIKNTTTKSQITSSFVGMADLFSS
jgi:hypothetical protein